MVIRQQVPSILIDLPVRLLVLSSWALSSAKHRRYVKWIQYEISLSIGQTKSRKKKEIKENKIIAWSRRNSQYYGKLIIFNLVLNELREDSNYIKQKNDLGKEQPKDRFAKETCDTWYKNFKDHKIKGSLSESIQNFWKERR